MYVGLDLQIAQGPKFVDASSSHEVIKNKGVKINEMAVVKDQVRLLETVTARYVSVSATDEGVKRDKYKKTAV